MTSDFAGLAACRRLRVQGLLLKRANHLHRIMLPDHGSRAPGQIRTDTVRVLNPFSLPVGVQGRVPACEGQLRRLRLFMPDVEGITRI